jgi:hypothetical protein
LRHVSVEILEGENSAPLTEQDDRQILQHKSEERPAIAEPAQR